MPADKPISNRQKCDEARREGALRRAVYPEMIKKGKLSAVVAARQIAIMDAIAEDYRLLADHDERDERLL